MKKVLYICQVEFSNPSDGVLKKVKAQLQAFTKLNCEVNCIAYYNGKTSFNELNDSLDFNAFNELNSYSGKLRRFKFWKTVRNYVKNEKEDIVYIRYSFIDYQVLRTLDTIKKSGAKIVLEIPSYGQTFSLSDGFTYIQYVFDKVFNRFCKKYVDKLVYIGEEKKKIFGMDAIPIPNGLPFGFDSFKRTGMNHTNSINLLAVSTMGSSRGYERLILGLKNYYVSCKNARRINIRFVGDGESVNLLKQLVKANELEDFVSFSTCLFGDELDCEFEKSTLGIGALGVYKFGSKQTSTLKVKEYFMRGLPFIYAGDEIRVPSNYKYALQFENNNSPIDFYKVVSFVDELDKIPKERIIDEMNSFGINNFLWQNILYDVCSCYL